MQQQETYTVKREEGAIEKQQAERKTQEAAIVKISKYFELDTVKARFASILGDRNVGAYISSALITVKESKKLQECHPETIYTSALHAATLRLSTDPATGEGWLVPYKGKCTFQPGYKGYYKMAVRTGKYRYINVTSIYEGQTVEEDQMTGFHSITGQPISDKRIGWFGSFELNPERGFTKGFGKTFYMTIEQIHEHAEHYSPSYSYADSPWKKETAKMEKKTVMKLLLKNWGYLDPADVMQLEQVDEENKALEEMPEITDPNDPDFEGRVIIPERDPQAEQHKRTTAENLAQLGFGA
jgi:recombination protein RecT